MKIAKSELVRRYLVKFSKEETTYLRNVEFLHPMCSAESEMWMTLTEVDLLKSFPCFASKEVDEALVEANREAFG